MHTLGHFGKVWGPVFTLPRLSEISEKNWSTWAAMNFSENEGLEPITIEKIKILGAVLELPAN